MKQINYIGSENVVNIASPKKIIIFGKNTYGNNGAFLPASTDKKIDLNQKIGKLQIILMFSVNISELYQNKFQ